MRLIFPYICVCEETCLLVDGDLIRSNHASRLPAKHITMFSISLTINITDTGKSAWYEIFSPHHDGIMMVWYTQQHTENDPSFTCKVIMDLVKVRQHDTNHR